MFKDIKTLKAPFNFNLLIKFLLTFQWPFIKALLYMFDIYLTFSFNTINFVLRKM